MKRYCKKVNTRRLLTFAAVIASISLCSAQTRAAGKYGEALFEGRPFFTDSAVYNSYDLGGSPLGLFEKGSPRFSAEFGNRSTSLGDRSGQYWDAPVFGIGNPGGAYFQAFYKPNVLNDKNGGNAADLTLNRFGFVGASQGTSGAMRASLLAEGFYGRQEWGGGDSARLVMGVERLRFDVGSRLHPLVRVGLYIGANVLYDTLYVSSEHRDVWAHTNLPEFGANVDVGGEDFPVRGNIDFSYAWSGFSYSLYRPGQPVPPTAAGIKIDGEDADAIRNDSLSVFLTALARLSPMADGNITLTPGLLLGYTGNSGEIREPDGGDNNYPIPLLFGGPRDNLSYSLTGFWFGAGAGLEAYGYVDAHVEYSLAALWLDCGSGYTGKEVEESRTIHNFAVGVASRMNRYVEIPFTVVPRAAWFISGTTSMVGAAQTRLSVAPLNKVSGMSMRALYEPQNFLSGFERVSGFTLGADGSALEERIFASIWATFLSSSESDRSGLEFGLRVGFAMK
jgi:hypothetical protein